MLSAACYLFAVAGVSVDKGKPVHPNSEVTFENAQNSGLFSLKDSNYSIPMIVAISNNFKFHNRSMSRDLFSKFKFIFKFGNYRGGPHEYKDRKYSNV